MDATQLAKSLQVSTNSQYLFSKRDSSCPSVFAVVIGCQRIAFVGVFFMPVTALGAVLLADGTLSFCLTVLRKIFES